MFTLRRLVALLGLGSLLIGSHAFAAAPVLSSGAQLNTSDPYATAQPLGDVFVNKGVYGKLQGSVPFDLYSFTATKDGEQTFTVLLPKDQPTTAQLAGIFVDPTSATSDDQVGLPTPTSGGTYHTTVLKQVATSQTFTDRTLLQQYKVVGQQRIALQKGKTYYIWILDSQRLTGRYTLQIGTGQPWSVKDFFSSFGSWLRLETNNYAGTSPFGFKSVQTGMTILLLGLMLLVGTFIVQQVFALSSNRNKAAGFLLIKLQPISRVLIWLALWFTLIGGYIFFSVAGWVGIPFILILLFILLLIAFLYETLSLSPRIARLEVTPEEAPLPLAIRKRWFFTGFIEFVLLVTTIIMLGMYLAGGFVK